MKYAIVLAFLMGATTALAQTDDYGKEEANTKFFRDSEQEWDKGDQEYNYLRLENHPAASGVPLGGIGAGNLQLGPDGRFVRIGINNIHEPVRESKASFFSLWYDNEQRKGAVRLVHDDEDQYGMEGVNRIFYTGLFPRVEMGFDRQSQPGVNAQIHAYSSLVAHDVKNSSLPVAYFDVKISAEFAGDYAVAFSMEDFISRGIVDPESIAGMDGQVDMDLANGEQWPALQRPKTLVEDYRVSRLKGVRQFAAKPLTPKRATHQNYNNEIALLAEQTGDVKITSLPSYNIEKGGKVWEGFIENGEFEAGNKAIHDLSTPDAEQEQGGSIISAKTHLEAGESTIIRFMVVWSAPEFNINRDRASREAYWTGGADYSKYYHNFFDDIDDIIHYGYKKREVNLEKTLEWQQPVMNSTLPDWYKFKLINSGYVIYTNMILNKKGDVTVNEGAMGGLAGTMDQRISAHPFYQKFFTQIDRSEMNIFADGMQPDGSITHFIGNYYFGMGTVGGRLPTEEGWMIDNTGGWIIQLAKDYEQTGDIEYLKKWSGRVYDGMDFLKSLMPEGVDIPIGPTTYDDYEHPPIYSYGASIYLATLRAAETIAHALDREAEEASDSFSGPISNGTVSEVDHAQKAEEFAQQFERTQQDMIDMLWNGRFFSYGCEVDGSGELKDTLFTGQLAGQFVSRYSGWGDVIPMEMTKASLVSQYKLALSEADDYYADKVWDIKKGVGIDNEGSQCWPFYLESYTGFTGFQAGYYEDTFELLKHIQLVHLRQGYTWSQNLWNPAPITYMTSPVSWFSTDVLAGAGLSIPENEIRLAPLVPDDMQEVMIPLYYPRFWAELSINTGKKSINLEITKKFDKKEIILSQLVSETPAESTKNKVIIDISDFQVREGNVLELSPHYDRIVKVAKGRSVLKNPDQFDFLRVE